MEALGVLISNAWGDPNLEQSLIGWHEFVAIAS